VLEGAGTVPLLYRAVRRLAGSHAAIVAAAVLAVSPATVALDRGNISDTLLVLLLVLATDAIVAALCTGRRGSLAMAALWVGLAFQAKMVEAWLVVPALAVVFLVAGAGTAWSRVRRVAAMVAVTVVVSLSWMVFVSLTPASQRPYVDGSQHNSIFEQVFDYNGFGRVGQPSPNAELGRTLGLPFLTAAAPSPQWNRLLTGSYGRDIGWLLPASLAAIVLGWVRRRRAPRTDRVRAGVLLWGTWLLVLGAVFSASATINAYYLAALAPPVAALIGIGSSLAWEGRHSVRLRVSLMGIVALTVGYAAWLLPGSGTGLPAWLRPTILALGVVVVALVGSTIVRRQAALNVAALLAMGATALLVPVVASVSVVDSRLGPFDTPFQPKSTTAFTRAFFGAPLDTSSTLPRLEAIRNGAPDLMATQTSVLAAPFIYASGQEVLPIGGYTGTLPEPSVDSLMSMARDGDFHLVLTAARSTDPRIVWIARHCLTLPAPPSPTGSGATVRLGASYCTRRQ
jgi:4-amino-4-deoxy-L-arabinose transferase-like glycosyltransferase